MADRITTDKVHGNVRNGDDYANGVKLDPTNLDASLKKLEEYMVGLKFERTSAQRALRAQSDLVGTVAHEMRTALGNIYAFSDLLLGAGLNDEQSQYATGLKQTADGLLVLLNDVIDHTRLTKGRLELSKRAFDLHELLASFAATLNARCHAKGLTSTVDAVGDLPNILEGDPTRIRQILMNFADNAVKFSEQGSVSLRAERVGTYPGGVVVRFSLTDTGIGISADARDRLFKRFEQADASIAETYGGAGLGLSICAQLVDLMDGQIGCESEPGEGSTFWFEAWLNRASEIQIDDDDLFVDAPSTPEASPEIVADEDEEEIPAARPSHILLVEDNKVNQMLVTTYLSKFGHTYSIAESGYEAIDAIKADAFDLVLMDLHMPEIDGFQTTAAIRKLDGRRSNVPIVALTADMLLARRRSYVEADMDACITKPVDAMQLHKTIAHFLEHGRDPGIGNTQVLPTPDAAEYFAGRREMA